MKVIFKTERQTSGDTLDRANKISTGILRMYQNNQSSHDFEKEMFLEFQNDFVFSNAINNKLDAESIEFIKFDYSTKQQTLEQQFFPSGGQQFQYTLYFRVISKEYDVVTTHPNEIYLVSDPSTKEIKEISIKDVPTKAYLSES